MGNIEQQVARRLEARRLQMRATFKEIGELGDITGETVGNVLRGHNSPTLRTLAKVTRAMGFRLVVKLEPTKTPRQMRTILLRRRAR